MKGFEDRGWTISVLRTLAALSFLVAVCAEGWARPSMRFVSDRDTVEVGQIFNMTLFVDSGGAIAASAGTIVHFDPQVVRVRSAQAHGDVFADPMVAVADVRSNRIDFAIALWTDEVWTDERVLDVEFEALAPGDSGVMLSPDLEFTVVGDPQGNVMPDLQVVQDGVDVVAAPEPRPSLQLVCGSATVEVGQIFDVEVVADSDGGLAIGAGTRVTFDPLVLAVLEAKASPELFAERLYVAENVYDDHVDFAGVALSEFPWNAEHPFRIRFRVIGAGDTALALSRNVNISQILDGEGFPYAGVQIGEDEVDAVVPPVPWMDMAVAVPDGLLDRGQIVTARVVVETRGRNVRGAGTRLHYDPAALKVVHAVANAAIFDDQVVENAEVPGQVDLAGTSLTDHSGSIELAAIQFETLANGDTELELDSSRSISGVYGATGNDLGRLNLIDARLHVGAFPADGLPITIAPMSGTFAPGERFTATVTVDTLGSGLYSINMPLLYDRRVVRAVAARLGPGLDAGYNEISIAVPSIVQLGIGLRAPIAGVPVIAEIDFEAVGGGISGPALHEENSECVIVDDKAYFAPFLQDQVPQWTVTGPPAFAPTFLITGPAVAPRVGDSFAFELMVETSGTDVIDTRLTLEYDPDVLVFDAVRTQGGIFENVALGRPASNQVTVHASSADSASGLLPTARLEATAVGVGSSELRIVVAGDFASGVADDDGLAYLAVAPPTTYSISVRPPNAPPTIGIAEPAGDVSVNFEVASLAVRGTAADPDGHVQSVAYRRNGGPWFAAALEGDDWSFTLPNLAVGTTHVDVQATDNESGKSPIGSFQVVRAAYVNTPPQITSVELESDPTMPLDQLWADVAGEAADPGGAVVRVFYTLDDRTTTTAQGTTRWAASPRLARGLNTLRLRATDNEGANSDPHTLLLIRKPSATDGGVDLFATTPFGDIWASENVQGGFESPQPMSVPGAFAWDPAAGDAILFGDVDGDGLDDAIAARANGSVRVAVNQGDGRLEALGDADSVGGCDGSGTCRILEGDFDGSGTADLAWISSGGAISVAFSTGGALYGPTPATPTLVPPAEDEGLVAAADCDGDGRDDIVRVLNATGEVVVLLAVAGSDFAQPHVAAAFSPLRHQPSARSSVVWGDWNGDGRADACLVRDIGVRTAFLTEDTLSLLPLGPLSYPGFHVDLVRGTGWWVIAGDEDGDGDDDLIQITGFRDVWTAFSTGDGRFEAAFLQNRLGFECKPGTMWQVTAGKARH